jgi:hypothetical protein
MYNEPEGNLEIYDEPEDNLEIYDEPEGYLEIYDEPEGTLEIYDEPEGTLEIYDEPEGTLEIYDEPEGTLEIYDEPEGTLEIYDEPEGTLEIYDEPEGTLEIYDEPEGTLEIYDEPEDDDEMIAYNTNMLKAMMSPSSPIVSTSEEQRTINNDISMEYNVIWIDDEWDTIGKPFMQICEKHNIHITPFKTRKNGMDLLLKDERPWDAVILDAKAYNESENETANLTGLYEAIKQIEGLKMRKSIPYFVLTRQPDLLDNDTFRELIGEFYKKGNAEEEGGIIKVKGEEQLIEDLKTKIGESSRHRVKERYKETVDVLNHINPKACENIIDILEVMHFPDSNPKFNYDESFNSLRKILESFYKKANEWQIIPDECVDRKEGNVNINQCVHYLSGRNADIVGIRFGNSTDRIVPRHIKDLMFAVQSLTNYLSHEYVNDNVATKPRDILFSLALQICEIILWLDNYIKSHQDIEYNKKMCKTIGVVEQLNDNSSICLIRSKRVGRESSICISYKMADEKELIGKKVVVLEEDLNTQMETKALCPYVAKKLQVLRER